MTKKVKDKKQEVQARQVRNRQRSKNVGLRNYPIGDFLIRLKNAVMARKKTFKTPSSVFIKSVAKTLVKEGFLDKITEDNRELSISIRYYRKEPVVTDIKLISKPGLRIYMTRAEIEKSKGPEILIVSTSEGVFSSMEAVKKGLGGEVIAKIL